MWFLVVYPSKKFLHARNSYYILKNKQTIKQMKKPPPVKERNPSIKVPVPGLRAGYVMHSTYHNFKRHSERKIYFTVLCFKN